MGIIAVIGSGMMGSAMARPAADKGHAVRLVGTPLDDAIIKSIQQTGFHPTLKARMPAGVTAYTTDALDTALSGCDLVIGGVSSFGVDWFLERALPHVPMGMPVLMITKGLRSMEGTLLPIPRELMRRTGRDNICAVGGPCTSYELMQRQHTRVAFCGRDPALLAKLRSALSTPYYHIRLTTDIEGLESAVALKNAYALGVSLAIGMTEKELGEGELRYNPQAGLFAEAVSEMSDLIAWLGGAPEQIAYAAGDLYVTIFGGRTRKLGTLLGRGLRIDEALAQLDGVTLESVAITRLVMGALRRAGLAGRYPLLSHVESLLRGENVGMPWGAFDA
ncbi:MAG: glycerol-3-phosphate dehydrogenase [Oscillospiraceae bacterium]|jgi:glycerol-3-phosphate dehydrogenase (NAD(P)+)|nr:glycerol-3-phosphate dehydrogenase [Oscillospiraceae bacterium]